MRACLILFALPLLSSWTVHAEPQEPSADRGLERLRASMELIREALEPDGEGPEAAREEIRSAVAELPAVGEVPSLEWGVVLYELAARSNDVGLLAGRLAGLERCVALYERELPLEDPDRLEAMQSLAAVHYDAGALPEAHRLYVSVHEVRERVLPADHPDLLDAKNNLGTTCFRLGDLEAARELLTAANAGYERVLPDDSPKRLSTRRNLANVLRTVGIQRIQQGDYATAVGLLEQVVELLENGPREAGLELVHARYLLAIALNGAGDYAGAERLFREFLEGTTDRANIVAAQTNLSIVLKNQGRFEEALELEESVLAALLEQWPEDDERVLDAKMRLAGTYSTLGRLRLAVEQLEDVHSLRASRSRPDAEHLLATKDALAEARMRNGDLDGARTLLEEALAAREESLAESDPRLLANLRILGSVLAALGDLEKALEVQLRVLAARERELPAGSRAIFVSKLDVASVLQRLGDYERALELEREVHDYWEEVLPPDARDLLIAKQNLAITLGGIGDIRGRLELCEQVHEAWVRLRPARDVDVLTAKMNLAAALANFGERERALELEEQVFAAWSQSLPPAHPRLLGIMRNLSSSRQQLGDLEGARVLAEEAYAACAEKAPHDPERLACMVRLAELCTALDDERGSLEWWRQIDAIYAEALPEEHPLRMTSLRKRARIHDKIGDSQHALVLTERAHAAQTRQLPTDHPDLIYTVQALANIRVNFGDSLGALELYERVQRTRERQFPAGHPELLSAKLGLSTSYSQLGEFPRALELLEEVVEGYEALLGPDHRFTVDSRLSLARVCFKAGDLARARRLLGQVLAWHEQEFSTAHPETTTVREHLALVLKGLGEIEQARVLQEQVLTERSDQAVPLEDARLNLATTCSDMGDDERAHELFSAWTHGTAERASALRGLPVHLGRLALSEPLRELGIVLSFSERLRSAGQPSLDAALFGLLESLRAQAVHAGSSLAWATRYPELEAVRVQYCAARARLAERVKVPPAEVTSLDAWRAQLVGLALERDRLEGLLLAELSDRGLSEGTIDAASVASGLEEGSVLLSFFRYPRFDEYAPGPPPRGSVDSLLAFAVLPDGTVRRIELGPCEVLERFVSEWRAGLGKPVDRGVVVGGSVASEAGIGKRLTEALLLPCLAALKEEPGRLHIVPDDFLHLVPFEALPWKEGRVGDRFEVRLELSARNLPAAPLSTRPGTLVALGGVDFDAEGVSPTLRTLVAAAPVQVVGGDRSGSPAHFGRLLQSRFEVEAVGALYREVEGSEPVLLLRGEATKKALFEHAASARYLHVATHGWFAPAVLGTAGHASELLELYSRSEEVVHGLAPDTLCGLALAGANKEPGEDGATPGILTAQELGLLDLSGCELAVLSACETNVGLRQAGLGIRSLQSALHGAGARTAITSLWKVDDAATRRLVEHFYTYLWHEELTKADALWKAKCDLRSAGHPPRDWAAWVLTGEPD